MNTPGSPMNDELKPTQFRKKPVVIDAFRYYIDPRPDWFCDRVSDNTIITHETHCEISTLEGVMLGGVGDYIIRGVKGEIYPCKPDIFLLTYEPAHLPAPGEGVGVLSDKAVDSVIQAVFAHMEYEGGMGVSCPYGPVRAALVAAGVGGEGWVECKERMPEVDTSVYIVRQGQVYPAIRARNAFINLLGWTMYHDHNVGDVTHWMPRPVPKAPGDGG